MENKETQTLRIKLFSIITFLLIIGSLNAKAADDKAVSGTYTYYGHPGMSMIEAK